MTANNPTHENSTRSSRLLSRLVISLGVVIAFVAGPAIQSAHASGSVNLAPVIVTFPNAVAGGACEGPGCTFAEVTVTNNTDAAVTLNTASTSSPVFFATFGGTCNVPDAFLIPAGSSCTFQWGFKPAKPGKALGVGTISFSDGETPSVLLTGIGSPH